MWCRFHDSVMTKSRWKKMRDFGCVFLLLSVCHKIGAIRRHKYSEHVWWQKVYDPVCHPISSIVHCYVCRAANSNLSRWRRKMQYAENNSQTMESMSTDEEQEHVFRAEMWNVNKVRLAIKEDRLWPLFEFYGYYIWCTLSSRGVIQNGLNTSERRKTTHTHRHIHKVTFQNQCISNK